VKLVLAVLILAGVGWQFFRILSDPQLQEPGSSKSPAEVLGGWLTRARHPGWLALSGALYLGGLCFSLGFWFRLLRVLKQQPRWPAAIRAYFIGHLGKYVPGKAWALILRTTLSSGPGVRLGVAALTAIYETLTTMAAGSLVSAVLFLWFAEDDGSMFWKAVGLLGLAGIPLFPAIFNRVIRRISTPFMKPDDPPLPPLGHRMLIAGLLLTACGWLFLGASLWAIVHALAPEPAGWSVVTWLRYSSYVALAYVAGYLTLPAPGGLGVRELLLQTFLAREFADSEHKAMTVAIVILLRLVWTVAEVLMAGIVYWLPGQGAGTKDSGQQKTSGQP
jgi:hypothetical protein